MAVDTPNLSELNFKNGKIKIDAQKNQKWNWSLTLRFCWFKSAFFENVLHWVIWFRIDWPILLCTPNFHWCPPHRNACDANFRLINIFGRWSCEKKWNLIWKSTQNNWKLLIWVNQMQSPPVNMKCYWILRMCVLWRLWNDIPNVKCQIWQQTKWNLWITFLY